MATSALNRDKKPDTWVGGRTTATNVYLNAEFSAGDRLVTAVHEATEHVGLPLPLPVEDYSSAAAAYNELPGATRGSAARWAVFLSQQGLLSGIDVESMKRQIVEIQP